MPTVVILVPGHVSVMSVPILCSFRISAAVHGPGCPFCVGGLYNLLRAQRPTSTRPSFRLQAKSVVVQLDKSLGRSEQFEAICSIARSNCQLYVDRL